MGSRTSGAATSTRATGWSTTRSTRPAGARATPPSGGRTPTARPGPCGPPSTRASRLSSTITTCQVCPWSSPATTRSCTSAASVTLTSPLISGWTADMCCARRRSPSRSRESSRCGSSSRARSLWTTGHATTSHRCPHITPTRLVSCSATAAACAITTRETTASRPSTTSQHSRPPHSSGTARSCATPGRSTTAPTDSRSWGQPWRARPAWPSTTSCAPR